MHLWRSKHGSFIRFAQLEFCARLIVVPLTTFHRLAEEIGDPRGELIFVVMTARCGSTLFTQVSQTDYDHGPPNYIVMAMAHLGDIMATNGFGHIAVFVLPAYNL